MASEKKSGMRELLEKTSLFANLSPAERELLVARVTRRVFAAGENLFHEGGQCDALHIIVSGRVRIYKSSAGGREQVLAVNGAGDTLAEVPVFDGGPYPASAVAVDEVEVARILRRDLHAVCMEHPMVALKVLETVGARLRALVGIIEELSFTTIRQRLVSSLLRLAQSSGRKTARGIEVTLPGSHQELAAELGTVRELVSRNLMRLQAEGLIEVDARQVVIRNVKALAAVLDGQG